MGFHFLRKNKVITGLICLFAVAMVLFPRVTETGSKTAIIIWANSIIPVLLPFVIFSDFIRRTGDMEKLPPRLYPFAIAFLSGYPMGARATADLLEGGRLYVEEGRWVLSYSLVTGPAFLMGTIGAFMGSNRAVLLVMFSHYISALLNGLLYRPTGVDGGRGGIVRSAAEWGSKEKERRRTGGESFLDSFTLSIMAGFRTMAMILAFLIIFMIVIHFMEFIGVFGLIGNELISATLKGLLEMTAGAGMVSACNATLQIKTILISMLVSFGGLSVIGQAAAITAGSGLRVGEIIRMKTTHGLLAGIVCTILWKLLSF